MDINMQEDDFADFLNLDNLGANFSLPLFDAQSANNAQEYEQLQQRQAAQHDGFQGMAPHQFDPHHQQMQGQAQQMDGYAQMNYGQMPPATMAAAGYPHPHLQKAMQPGSAYPHTINGAPPTPHSGELNAKAAAFQAAQASAQQHHYMHRNGDPNAFTPFLSPELDGSTSVMSQPQGYATPGVYNLSPLTSPAMGPHHAGDGRAPRSHPMTASGSLVGSPVDGSTGPDGVGDEDDDTERPRKTRRKAPQKKASATSAPRQRKTPLATPQQKRGLNLQIPGPNASGNASSESPFSAEAVDARIRRNESASSSISPRPLADAIMAPPPKPQTPTAAGQPVDASSNQHMIPQNGRPAAAPATPTSMMKLKSPAGSSTPGSHPGSLSTVGQTSPSLESTMEFLKLPEAATGPVRSDDGPSSKASVQQLPKLKTKPSLSASNNNSESPITSAVASPAGPTGSSKPDAKGGRQAKKRNSSSSNLVSPALRPKVSPSVKPLLPEGTPIDSQTHALLLASRSNYENILSGSHLPGVSYPADLSANLTSKRTSHKIAEQGRRNRINLALQEMQGLLPAKFAAAVSPTSKASDSGEKGNGSGGKTPSTPTQGGSSKAATVECAIEYIKALQHDTSQKDVVIEQMKLEIDSLRLKAGEGGATN